MSGVDVGWSRGISGAERARPQSGASSVTRGLQSAVDQRRWCDRRPRTPRRSRRVPAAEGGSPRNSAGEAEGGTRAAPEAPSGDPARGGRADTRRRRRRSPASRCGRRRRPPRKVCWSARCGRRRAGSGRLRGRRAGGRAPRTPTRCLGRLPRARGRRPGRVGRCEGPHSVLSCCGAESSSKSRGLL